jgi:dTDP-glucose pyrophosphorylase
MWGIVPAAGMGTRIQPLAFSKELLPVGSRVEGGAERPRAVSEYVVERMVKAGADRICMVISPGKADIVNYFGGSVGGADVCYVVQDRAGGLCDAIFRALPLIAPDEHAVVGLPDTVWFPDDALALLPDEPLSFLLFPVERPELFDAVLAGPDDYVEEIRVKHAKPSTQWVWGAFKLTGRTLRELHALWEERDRADPYIGTLVNAWLGRGHRARAVRAGTAYVDVGTLNGYREAQKLLLERGDRGT